MSLYSVTRVCVCGCVKDVFFYSLVYDNQQKSLIADHGEIRVGLRYQVEVIPDKLESRTYCLSSTLVACILTIECNICAMCGFRELYNTPDPFPGLMV